MLKKSLVALSCGIVLNASTTMCYKKDHLDPSTIETISLDGGECKGKLSVDDMKKDGYIVDSMKIQNGIDGLNYIYVFKKDSYTRTVLTTGVSTSVLKNQLKEIESDNKKQKEMDGEKSSLASGKKIYKLHCISCHGKSAEIEAYNTARALNTLSIDEIKSSIRSYSLDEKDNGMGILMKPYANLLNDTDANNVSKYIQTLK